MATFTFGCAADLYRERVHPRVLIGPDDLARLRDRVKRGGGRRLMQALREFGRVYEIEEFDNKRRQKMGLAVLDPKAGLSDLMSREGETE